jgi:hypothetical protein
VAQVVECEALRSNTYTVKKKKKKKEEEEEKEEEGYFP